MEKLRHLKGFVKRRGPFKSKATLKVKPPPPPRHVANLYYSKRYWGGGSRGDEDRPIVDKDVHGQSTHGPAYDDNFEDVEYFMDELVRCFGRGRNAQYDIRILVEGRYSMF